MSVTAYTGMSEELRDRVAGQLQPLLVDLVALALQGKQLHWNVTGPLFSPVHAQLDQVVADAQAWADDVAERIVTIGVAAAAQAADVARESSLPSLPAGMIPDRQAISLAANAVAAVADRARPAMDRLGDLDMVSQDLVIGVLRGLEKHLWMLRTQEE